MFIIKDKQLRKRISIFLHFASYKIKSDFPKSERFKLDDIDFMGKLASKRHRSAIKNLREALPLELTYAFLGVMALFALHAAVFDRKGKDKKNPITKKWLKKGQHPDPNFIFGNFLSTLTNSAFGVLYLAESGLDYPSRVLFRCLSEQFALALLISSDRDAFNDFVDFKDEEQERKLWRQKFTPAKLNRALERLDKGLGLAPDLVTNLARWRKNGYTFRSLFAHGTFAGAVVPAFVGSLNNYEALEISIFGAASVGIKNTLIDLNHWIVYFLSMIWSIFYKIHKFKLDLNDDLWRVAIIMKNIYVGEWAKYCIESAKTQRNSHKK